MNVRAIPEVGQIWTHEGSNVGYVIKGVTNLNATKPGWEPQVVYADDPANLWSRPLNEFLDKFRKGEPHQPTWHGRKPEPETKEVRMVRED